MLDYEFTGVTISKTTKCLYSRDRQHVCEDCEKSEKGNMKNNQIDFQDIRILLISYQDFVFVVNPKLSFQRATGGIESLKSPIGN